MGCCSNKHMTLHLRFSVLAASLGMFQFGYNTAIIAGAQHEIEAEFHPGDVYMGVVVSCILFGAIVGSIAGRSLADDLGRRRALLVADIFYLVGSCGMMFASGIVMLVLMRFLSGIAVGLCSTICSMYVAEIAPSKVRGSLVGFAAMSTTCGIFISYLVPLAVAYSPYSWRTMLGLAALPALLQLALATRFMPESPRWLAARGRHEQASLVLRLLCADRHEAVATAARLREVAREQAEAASRGNGALLASPRSHSVNSPRGMALVEFNPPESASSVSAPLTPGMWGQRSLPQAAGARQRSGSTASAGDDGGDGGDGASLLRLEEGQPPPTADMARRQLLRQQGGSGGGGSGGGTAGSSVSWRELLTSYEHRRALTLGVGLNVLQQVCGINVVVYFSNTVLAAAGFGYTTALLLTVAVSASQIALEALLVRVVDHVGRRPLALCGVGAMTAVLGCLALSFLPALRDLAATRWVAVSCLLLYRLCFSLSLGPLPCVITTEVFAPAARSRGMALSWASNWVSNFLVSLSFLPLVQALGESGVFFLYQGLCALGTIFVACRLHETKGKSLEDL